MLNHYQTAGYPVVNDFRESDAWNEARVLVCAFLDLAGRLSGSRDAQDLARAVEHHAVTLLDSLARGYVQEGKSGTMEDAYHALECLETLLQEIRTRGAIAAFDCESLKDRLGLTMRSVNMLRYRHSIALPNHRRWE